jgi:hypothetical protein
MHQKNMITKVSISESNSPKVLAFFEELDKKKAETIKKAEDRTKHIRERLIKLNAAK